MIKIILNNFWIICEINVWKVLFLNFAVLVTKCLNIFVALYYFQTKWCLKEFKIRIDLDIIKINFETIKVFSMIFNWNQR